ncbi:glycosyl hydrolase [Streptomyces sp. NPDC047000]|uniref:glycoside hydrolase family 26 protein n=1 Tax=Streptomyces sp. NPDC047000 TaxID=3155474 RepID=UPI0033CA01DA
MTGCRSRSTTSEAATDATTGKETDAATDPATRREAPPRRARYRRPAGASVTAALAATAAFVALAAGPGSAAPTSAGAGPFGAFLGSGALGAERTAGFSAWLGGADLRVGHTYLPGGRWSDIEGTPAVVDVWAHWRAGKADRMLVLNVPMLEGSEDGLPDDEVRSLLRRGAAGEFDAHFRRLARRLVDTGAPDTVVVLGWEMNGTTYTHRCGPDPEAWKAYWNRIVAAMRAVPGQRLRFDFAPNRGRDAVPWPECYPGDATVDVIGMDAYDQPAGMSFDQQVAEPYGLQAQADFAASHGKPLSYPEWGLFRNGDNPGYMRGMLTWMTDHQPLYNTLTDYCPHGVWECSGNPRASAVYRAQIAATGGGAGTGAGPGVTPAPSPSPAAPR